MGLKNLLLYNRIKRKSVFEAKYFFKSYDLDRNANYKKNYRVIKTDKNGKYIDLVWNKSKTLVIRVARDKFGKIYIFNKKDYRAVIKYYFCYFCSVLLSFVKKKGK